MRIFLLEDGVTLPAHGMYFVVARDGMYLRKENVVGRGLVPVPRISFLNEVAERAAYCLPPLPAALVANVLSFFRRIYQLHQSEAIVLVHYHEAEKAFRLSCPEQVVDGGGIYRYDAMERFDGYLLVGSIHSHAEMDAFHSCIDEKDEKKFDGVHCTMGRFDTDYVDIRCSLVMNGARFNLQPRRVFGGLTRVNAQAQRDPALAAIKVKPMVDPWSCIQQLDLFRRRPSRLRDPFDDEGESWLDTRKSRGVGRRPERTLFDLTLPDGTDWRTLVPPAEWVEQVITTTEFHEAMSRSFVVSTSWEPGGGDQ